MHILFLCIGIGFVLAFIKDIFSNSKGKQAKREIFEESVAPEIIYEPKPKKKLPAREDDFDFPEEPANVLREEVPVSREVYTPQHSEDNGVRIDIDRSSLARFNIRLDNLSVEFDPEEDEYLDLMFDVYPISGNRIKEDVSIVISLYIGNRRVDCSEELLYAEDFYRRDTINSSFFKTQISRVSRIELYAKKY